MVAVKVHGEPLVDHPARVGQVSELGVDETSYLKANREHLAVYATGLVDTKAGILIDMVEGNTAADLRKWRQRQPTEWLAGIGTVSIDITDSYRSGLSPHLDHALRVADPLPCGSGDEPLSRQGTPSGPARDSRSSRPQRRPALSDPQTVVERLQAARRQKHRPHAPRATSRRPMARSHRSLASQRISPRQLPCRRHRRCTRPCR